MSFFSKLNCCQCLKNNKTKEVFFDYDDPEQNRTPNPNKEEKNNSEEDEEFGQSQRFHNLKKKFKPESLAPNQKASQKETPSEHESNLSNKNPLKSLNKTPSHLEANYNKNDLKVSQTNNSQVNSVSNEDSPVKINSEHSGNLNSLRAEIGSNSNSIEIETYNNATGMKQHKNAKNNKPYEICTKLTNIKETLSSTDSIPVKQEKLSSNRKLSKLNRTLSNAPDANESNNNSKFDPQAPQLSQRSTVENKQQEIYAHPSLHQEELSLNKMINQVPEQVPVHSIVNNPTTSTQNKRVIVSRASSKSNLNINSQNLNNLNTINTNTTLNINNSNKSIDFSNQLLQKHKTDNTEETVKKEDSNFLTINQNNTRSFPSKQKDSNNFLVKTSNKSVSDLYLNSKVSKVSSCNNNDLLEKSSVNNFDRREEEISFKHDNIRGIHFDTNYNNIGSSQKLNLYTANLDNDLDAEASEIVTSSDEIKLDREFIEAYPTLRVQSRMLNNSMNVNVPTQDNEEGKEVKEKSLRKLKSNTNTESTLITYTQKEKEKGQSQNNRGNVNNVNNISALSNIDNCLFKNTEVYINAQGLLSKQLLKDVFRDNLTYFGRENVERREGGRKYVTSTSRKSSANNTGREGEQRMNIIVQGKNRLPDVALNLNSKNTQDRCLLESNIHNYFCIYFCLLQKEYYFKFLTNPNIDKALFYLKLKQNKMLVIDKTIIIQVGNCLLKIIPGKIGRISFNQEREAEDIGRDFIGLEGAYKASEQEERRESRKPKEFLSSNSSVSSNLHIGKDKVFANELKNRKSSSMVHSSFKDSKPRKESKNSEPSRISKEQEDSDSDKDIYNNKLKLLKTKSKFKESKEHNNKPNPSQTTQTRSPNRSSNKEKGRNKEGKETSEDKNSKYNKSPNKYSPDNINAKRKKNLHHSEDKSEKKDKSTKSIVKESKSPLNAGNTTKDPPINYDISIVKYDKDPSNNKLFKFNSTTKSHISIGRSSDCDIQMKNSFVSKIHCRISYDRALSKWVIFDGTEKKPSSHGSWMILNSKISIEDGSEIKFNNYLLMFSFVKSSSMFN